MIEIINNSHVGVLRSFIIALQIFCNPSNEASYKPFYDKNHL
jgi:hypothetical protein